MEMVALLARERKWRRDRAALAKMDYAALRDIGFTSAPWNTEPGPSDRFVRNIAWTSDKRLRALLDDCSRSRKAAQASVGQNRVDGSGSLDGSLRAGRIPRLTEKSGRDDGRQSEVLMYVRDYSSLLPASQAGYRKHDLRIISAFALGGLALCLVTAVFEPGFAQTFLASVP